MAEDMGMSGFLGSLASKVDSKMSLLKDVVAEYSEIKHVIDGVAKEKEKLQQEKERFQHEKEMLQHEQHANGEALAAMKEDLLASKEEILQKNSDLEFLKKKLQESEAKNSQVEQSVELIQAGGVQTGPMQKRKRPSEGPLDYSADENEHTSQLDGPYLSPSESLENLNVQTRSVEKEKRLSEIPLALGNDAVNLEVTEECSREEPVNNPPVGQTSCVLVGEEDDLKSVRDELIKGFLEINDSRRKIGIKEMGELDEKAFKAACLAKVPPEEVDAAFYQLYSLWQQQIGDVSWYPFKTVMVDGSHKEIVNADDDKLQELKRAWGSGAHDAVVNALVEMKDYGRLSNRYITYELWNYKEGRKATMRECINYMSNQVKQLMVAKRRGIRRAF